ncbi:MAG: hydrolase [Clostridiales bacterium]|nr:hydrolase [Clostridiales bacterium]
MPSVCESIKWESEKGGVAGRICFEVYQDDALVFEEGNPVMLKENEEGVFYGFVFSKKRYPNKKTIKVIGYDQRRYLKNKATYVFENKTASEIIKMIGADHRFNLGEIEDTGYKIPSRVEENKTLIDIIITALSITLQNTGKLFILDDEFGKLTLRNAENLKLNILIDEETAETYDYETTIDKNTYNRIKLTKNNEEDGVVEIFIAQDSTNINKWGLLQYFSSVDDGLNPQHQANSLLSLYNKKPRKLKIKKAIGNVRLKAGYSPVVLLNLDDTKISNYMLIDHARHTIKNDEYFVDLTLVGGEFNVG